MTQEDKDLLIRDLCSRLPYGVFCEGLTTDIDIYKDKYYYHKVKGVLSDIHNYKSNCSATIGLVSECELETIKIKPYLFPIESMTEEQKIIYSDLCYNVTHSLACDTQSLNKLVDWLDKNKFDHRGLITKGLANDDTGLNIY